MKNIKRIILILIIVSLLTSCTTPENQSNISGEIQAELAISENTVDNQNNHDLSSSSEKSLDNREVISVSADELIKEFSENEILAMEKYKGKTVTISGIIFEKGRPKDFIPETDASYVIFGDYEKNGWCVQGYFDKIEVDDLKKDDLITVTGNYREVDAAGDVWKTIVFGECKR